jgi:diamine N-acetyltransferase
MGIFCYNKSMILKGKKVVLRPTRVSDAVRFVKWFNDPKVNKFMFVRHLTLKGEIKYLKNAIKDKSRHNMAIEVGGKHIGVVGLEVNKQNNRANFGLMIGEKQFWGQGIGEESSRLMIDFAFKKLKLHRLELDVYDYNPRAQNLYRKLGFKKEGFKREHNLYTGKYRKVIYMGLLDREWKNRKKLKR